MASELEQLAAEKYVLLTTFRKSGEGVRTPVWLAGDGAELVVWTEAKSGKVKRIRRDGKVEMQACDARGKRTHGPVVAGQARVLDRAGSDRVTERIIAKYGLVGRLFVLGSKLRGGRDRTLGLAIGLPG